MVGVLNIRPTPLERNGLHCNPFCNRVVWDRRSSSSNQCRLSSAAKSRAWASVLGITLVGIAVRSSQAATEEGCSPWHGRLTARADTRGRAKWY